MSSIEIRRRTNRLAPRSPDIDGFLPDSVTDVLYKKWNSEKWGEPITLSGGTLSITCDMVRDVGYSALSKVYGARRAKVLMDVANREAL